MPPALQNHKLNWTAISLFIGLIANAGVGMWFASSAFTKLETKLDYMVNRLEKMETNVQTKEMARADARSQEIFNNMYDVRLRVLEEQTRALGARK